MLIVTKTCYNCGQSGHLSRDCSEPTKDKVHIIEVCAHCQSLLLTRCRAATTVETQAICPATALTVRRVVGSAALVPEAEAEADLARSATSAARSDTSPATALKVAMAEVAVAMVEVVVATVEVEVTMVVVPVTVALVAVATMEDRRATRAVDMVT